MVSEVNYKNMLIKKQINTTNFKARDEIVSLLSPQAIGVELGVAEGKFAEKLLRKGDFKHLYGVDRYAGDRGHDDEQYQQALELLSPYKGKYSLIRESFSDALGHFEDEYFDFIYIDGYAHTGQHEGETLRNWYPKLKNGGIFSGDDYSLRWAENYRAINQFIAENNLKLHIINDWNSHRSWLVRKG